MLLCLSKMYHREQFCRYIWSNLFTLRRLYDHSTVPKRGMVECVQFLRKNKHEKTRSLHVGKHMNVLLWLWQLPQNILGLLAVIIARAKKTKDGIWICKQFFDSAVSLGDFIIFQEDCITTNSVKHEKGHQKKSQSL